MCYRHKEVTEAEKLAHISFFEIRPIIFSLREDAKLGKPMRSKQKIRERCTESCERHNPTPQEEPIRMWGSLPSAPFNLWLVQGSRLIPASVIRWEASLWVCVEETTGQQSLRQGGWYNQTSEDHGSHESLLIPSSGFQILNLLHHSFPYHSHTHRSL